MSIVSSFFGTWCICPPDAVADVEFQRLFLKVDGTRLMSVFSFFRLRAAWWSVTVSTIRRQSVRSLAFLQAEWIPTLTDWQYISINPPQPVGTWASTKSTQRGFSKTVCSRNEWGLMWVDRCGLKRLWRLPALHGPTILIVECTQRYFWQL